MASGSGQKTWTCAERGPKMNMRSSRGRESQKREERRTENQCSQSSGNFYGTGIAKVDLESKLGKTVVITKTTPQCGMGGPLLQCVVKDSINLLDHINGKKHQRNLGTSMCVGRSTPHQVKKRFEVNKRKMEEKQKDYDFEERVKELREEEEKSKAYKGEKQKEKKRRDEADLTFEEEDEMAAVMGFSAFGRVTEAFSLA